MVLKSHNLTYNNHNKNINKRLQQNTQIQSAENYLQIIITCTVAYKHSMTVDVFVVES